jgi:hypothetical protein
MKHARAVLASLAAVAALLAGCSAQAVGRPIPLRIDVFNVDGADLGVVQLDWADRHGHETMLHLGTVQRNLTVEAGLPRDGGELLVRVGERQSGRTISGDCIHPQASVLLEPYGRYPDVVRIEVRSLCPAVPLA